MSGDWFKTGDLGFIDEAGDLHLNGRVDNLIRVGHEKVSPEEIEHEMLGLAGVLDAAVAGAPDPRLFEVPIALVVRDGRDAHTPEYLRAMLARRLPRLKVPRRVFLVDQIPKTPYGKTDRRSVAELVKSLEDGQPPPAAPSGPTT